MSFLVAIGAVAALLGGLLGFVVRRRWPMAVPGAAYLVWWVTGAPSGRTDDPRATILGMIAVLIVLPALAGVEVGVRLGTRRTRRLAGSMHS